MSDPTARWGPAPRDERTEAMRRAEFAARVERARAFIAEHGFIDTPAGEFEVRRRPRNETGPSGAGTPKGPCAEPVRRSDNGNRSR